MRLELVRRARPAYWAFACGSWVRLRSTDTSSEAELMALVTSETGLSPVRIHGSTSAPTLNAADLADTDVAVIESLLRDYSESETKLVADWVAGGHGLVVLNGFTADAARAQSFAKNYAVTFGAFIQQTTAAYVSTFAVHPLTAGVSSLYFFGWFPDDDDRPNGRAICQHRFGKGWPRIDAW